jgi:hypothetical protein
LWEFFLDFSEFLGCFVSDFSMCSWSSSYKPLVLKTWPNL